MLEVTLLNPLGVGHRVVAQCGTKMVWATEAAAGCCLKTSTDNSPTNPNPGSTITMMPSITSQPNCCSSCRSLASPPPAVLSHYWGINGSGRANGGRAMERRKEGHHTIPARQFLPNQTMPDHTMPNCSTMSYYNIVQHHASQPPNGLPNQTMLLCCWQ